MHPVNSSKGKGLGGRALFVPDPAMMRLAIAAAQENLSSGAGGPFGACIVQGQTVLAVAQNRVLAEQDATSHAEINAIRAASRVLGTHDLSGCVIYSTTEPCPMCFAAIHWANLAHIVYGTQIRDVQRLGFNELPISNAQLRRLGRSSVRLHRAFLRRECQQLLSHWLHCGQGHCY